MKAMISKLSTFLDDIVARIQNYFANRQNRVPNNLQKIQTETTRQQWGDDKVFNQSKTALGGATNIAPKKPEPKKEPLLK